MPGVLPLLHKIELLPVTALKPFDRNARTHSPDQVAKIAAAMLEYGWTNPILADDDGVVIAGHGRLLAAESLGIDRVPVIRLSHLTPDQARAVRIGDNRLAELSGWDDVLLAPEIQYLLGQNVDVGTLGFTDADLSKMLDGLMGDEPGAGDEDVVPEPPVDPATRLGDLWLLGDHRLLCGDATSADDVARLLDGARPHLMVCDPPYGVSYDPAWRNDAGVSATARIGAVSNDDRADWHEAWSLFPGDVAYVWHAGVHGHTVTESLEACGLAIRAQLIWVKNRFALSRGHYHWHRGMQLLLETYVRRHLDELSEIKLPLDEIGASA